MYLSDSDDTDVTARLWDASIRGDHVEEGRYGLWRLRANDDDDDDDDDCCCSWKTLPS